jgi:hypothetical protein
MIVPAIMSDKLKWSGKLKQFTGSIKLLSVKLLGTLPETIIVRSALTGNDVEFKYTSAEFQPRSTFFTGWTYTSADGLVLAIYNED